MSSTYYILCLSHDPAITINEPGYNQPEEAEEAIRDRPAGHEHCDLMIGRYSYPLVELGCPASSDQPAELRCTHSATVWTGSGWLRLLAAAYGSADPNVRQAAEEGRFQCLPPERLRRLRVELGLVKTSCDCSSAVNGLELCSACPGRKEELGADSDGTTLAVRDLTPGETCEERDEPRATLRASIHEVLLASFDEADRRLITGHGAGEARGFLGQQMKREPTPAERALALLEPHLRAVPLYRSGPPTL